MKFIFAFLKRTQSGCWYGSYTWMIRPQNMCPSDVWLTSPLLEILRNSIKQRYVARQLITVPLYRCSCSWKEKLARALDITACCIIFNEKKLPSREIKTALEDQSQTYFHSIEVSHFVNRKRNVTCLSVCLSYDSPSKLLNEYERKLVSGENDLKFICVMEPLL